jgi:putative addiction module component (TIGR02574 family)
LATINGTFVSRQALDSAKELAFLLPNSERAELASALIASLDGPPDVDVAEQWEREILRRLDSIDQGGATFLSVEETIARVRRRLEKI